jgi:hypothetical protein
MTRAMSVQRERLLLSLAGWTTGTDMLGALAEARSWFGASRAQLQEQRIAGLRDLLDDASRNVPYWRDLSGRRA